MTANLQDETYEYKNYNCLPIRHDLTSHEIKYSEKDGDERA